MRINHQIQSLSVLNRNHQASPTKPKKPQEQKQEQELVTFSQTPEDQALVYTVPFTQRYQQQDYQQNKDDFIDASFEEIQEPTGYSERQQSLAAYQRVTSFKSSASDINLDVYI